MKHFILHIFSAKDLWKEILDREGFSEPERAVEAGSVLTDTFSKSPLLSNFLKKREIDLLKRSTLRDVPVDFVLGQISENRFIRSYDVSPKLRTPETIKEKDKVILKKDFIEKWNKKTK